MSDTRKDKRWLLVGAALDPGPAGALARRALRRRGLPAEIPPPLSRADRVANALLRRVRRRL